MREGRRSIAHLVFAVRVVETSAPCTNSQETPAGNR